MKKTLLITLILLICLTFGGKAFAWDESWDYAAPAGTADAGTLDTAIQDFKKGVAERLNQDHWFEEDNTEMNDLTAGDHRQVTMLMKSSAPAHAADTGIVYSISDSGYAELGYTDDSGNDIQITKDGGLNITTLSDLTITNSLSVGNDITVNDDARINGDLTADGQVWSADGLLSSGYDTYDSGWFSASSSGTYTKSHGLGTTNLLIQLYWASDASGTGMVICVQIGNPNLSDYWGGIITDITTTQITAQAGNDGTALTTNSSGVWTAQTSGYYRVIAIALD